MLRSLEIQNFKGIREGKLEELAQVNVLVGRNNSGKSTILDALIMLRCALMGTDYLDTDGLEQIVKRRVHRPVPSPGALDYDQLWFMSNTQVPIVFAPEFANGAKFLEEWDRYLSGTIRWGSYIWRFTRNYNKPRYPPVSSDWDSLKEHIGQEAAAHFTRTHMIEPGGIHRPFAERVWSELSRDRRDKHVVQMLNVIYQTNIEYLSFELFDGQTRLVAAFPHAGVPVDWLGDGMRYAVNILALGVLLKGTALLVEELETHQHPESLRKLTQTLFELAKQQDLQLFLTTHSLELIDYAMEAAEEKRVELKLYHMSLNQEGSLRATPFPRPDAKLLLDIGHDPRLHYKYIETK